VDRLTIFGLLALTAGMLCYALEDPSTWFTLAFAIACICGSLYGFMKGAWPFGIVEAIWALIALMRFFKIRNSRMKSSPN